MAVRLPPSLPCWHCARASPKGLGKAGSGRPQFWEARGHMSVDHIRYDLLAQEALRSVVRRVLADVGRDGLPGEHHFYISFDTRAPGVRLSPRMLEKYPEEMTIVIQHQFWDLLVTDTQFEIGLSFGGVPEKLVVPFTALKGFFDPSVKFGLQFELVTEDGDDEDFDDETADEPGVEGTTPFPRAAVARASRGAGSEPEVAGAAEVVPEADQDQEKGDTPAEEGAKVVQLDVFRNKK